jgi:hypothetical protein
VHIHISTIERRMASFGLHGRRPSKKPLISAKNRKAGHVFAQQYKSRTSLQWSQVLWNDGSEFNLLSSDGIRYIRRPVNKKFDNRYQLPSVKHGGENVLLSLV